MNLLDSQRVQALLDRAGAEPQAPLDSCRLFHGRGQCYPGREHIVVDFFAPVILITFFAEPHPDELPQLLDEVAPIMAELADTVVVQRRYLAGSPNEVVKGQLPEDWRARRGNITFGLSLQGQQNLGYFLDMEPGRRWLERGAPGKKVLNLFAYTCALSVVAVAAGARQVVNVDMSKQALARGRRNHQINGLDKRASGFLPEQILKSWSRVKKPGPYDVVILDPPSFQKGSFVASRDYAKLIKRLPELMPGGGEVLACLNAPELPEDFLSELFSEYCPGAAFVERLAPCDDFPDKYPDRQLKLTHWHLPAA
ncbi:class I SAM-dependent methyltransferase [Gilvimarinus sp. SDUM040013]|uniref:Class I SAM-dependent methyltransferase n=1 Tax=Gilvimarinus gilvus TaxID=3058038 RepID=A0ABU4S2L0_9GAMM|nr:class I SAM-dependent methyltransferase [Gilvimarinus sp. SDUM040013]MDO3385422.1 class I SAM-dependent methyltransferase [Gilvimarinus sp. SDUM040013]MDX6851317.1 class I SAM-dependent methyltransferase [Gilvimarinus sp. SDUM040013]